ncbi:uncharacterized protein KD926_010455 [Aspergillus affinis]|uniref:uncharacterized protein n=1 Tax=Aspergillus affinis TaxID=1070780 RepID=UPI0022FDF2FE|nr:uncharacterized protein KD926_010455 [Aspergillus affinis]KAI9038720.1 hypothetical protein KD926_010455 [Aspergillus affinis]
MLVGRLQRIHERCELTPYSNKFGICGLGPDFCGDDVCVAGCDSKAECDPGFGSKWSEKSGCPLNLCCSKFGFCGVTKEFCGNKTVTHKTCSKDGYLSRVVGYYEGWSTRRACNTFWPEMIPLGVYSHINFAFATIDPETYEVLPADEADIPLYERLTTLKRYDPDLKVLIALGGWTFNDLGLIATVFSDIAASAEKQEKFFKSLVSFMSTYDFDGVDLDWEYPEADDRSGKPVDYDNFPKFLANLKSTLDKTPGRNELSITLPASYWYLQHFDLKKLGKHVTLFNIMTYDMHGTWDRGNKWTGEYLNAHINLTEIKNSLDLLWRNDVKAEQMVMGLAFYGRGYTVASPSCVEPGCLYLSGSVKTSCSHETGILLNSEIVETTHTKGLSSKLCKDVAVKCLGGVMVWAISHDTKNATFSEALAKVSNRRAIAQRQVEDQDHSTDTIEYDTCKWSNCGEPCPAKWKMVGRDDEWRNDKDGYMLDTTGCNGAGVRSWCCPPTKLPKCGWYSFENGHCHAQCPDGRAACCTTEDDDGNELMNMVLYNAMKWGDSPSCDLGACGAKGTDTPDVLVESATGSGGSYCLPGDVYKDGVFPKQQLTERKLWTSGQRCWSGCPEDTVRVAMDTYNEDCYAHGGKAFCCNAIYYLVKNSICGVDCAFLLNYFTQDVLVDPPRLPGGNNFKASSDRFMDPLGSNQLRNNFRLLDKALNTLKGNSEGRDELEKRMNNILRAKRIGEGLSVVRDVSNLPDANVNDLFLYNLMKEIAEESHEFVKKYLASFITYWGKSNKPGDKDWQVKMEQVQEFVNAIEKQLDKIHINLKDLF